MNSKPFRHLYIHIPFCRAKCSYCNFYSITDIEKTNAYLKLICRELEHWAPACGTLKSIFIGGGTPTILTAKQLNGFFAFIKRNFSISPTAEITIESNPETLDELMVETISRFVNRVSMGVQSFCPDSRKVLGRAGSVDKIRKAVRLLKENGVENLNADLIYAIPGQTIEAWKEELIQAVDLGIKHLSAYSLTIEEGTALAQKKLAVPDDELAAEMWQVTGELLSKSNLYRYEISNYASPGNECIHNNCVWHGEPYLGCGPAAASFDGSARWCNCSDLDSWLLGQEAEQDELSAEGRAREIFVIGLRTVQGWNWQEFKDLTGFDFYSFNLPDDKRMFSVDTENNYRLTESGLLFWDTIAENII